MSKILDKINSPKDLKGMDAEQLIREQQMNKTDALILWSMRKAEREASLPLASRIAY